MKEISAGGVVYRRLNGDIELLMIEDRYRKISLPKGKQEAGESIEETALREVNEETGIVGRIIEPLEIIYYQYDHPQLGMVHKEVHYFLIEGVSGELAPQLEEINVVKWMEPKKAWHAQQEHGYDNNHVVLEKAFERLQLPKENLSS